MFKNITAVKAASRFFFSPSSMSFFNSRIESRLITRGNRQFFVTSEQFVPVEPREFTVREVTVGATGLAEIDTLGEFQAHATREAALAAIESIGVSA